MSDVLYPLGLISSVEATPFTRVARDEFEDGTTSSRRLWSDKYVKRRFEISHAPLTFQEYRWLKGFYTQRNGSYDYFWFRDNVNRAGNAKVRFTAALPTLRESTIYRRVRCQFEEVAPIRALPEINELRQASAALLMPVVWYDASREFYLEHMDTAVYGIAAYDAALKYDAPWYAGALPLGNYLGQWQHYQFAGGEKAKSSNLTELAGTQPACTIFAIVRQSSTATKQVLFAAGAMGTGNALGLALAADNRYEPWLGGAEVFTNARYNNSAADTWRSVALVWPASSNNVTLYVNAVSVGTDTVTRNLTAGPAALGAAFDGTLPANPSNAMANCHLAHALIFAGALTLADIKAVHNLLGYQYGLAVIP